VQVLHGKVEGDYWVARRSIHADAHEKGTASWDEFEDGLRVEHSKKEGEYTPDVADVVEVCSWPLEAMDGWEQPTLAVFEIKHNLPTPLSPRVFSTLIASGRVPSKREFLTVQVPLAPLADASAAKYGKDGSIVHGAYAAVERVWIEEGKVHWDMATASDAKGNLPLVLQKSGVAGAVVQDVGLFLGWVDQMRVKT
jgi:hypothetical protein